MISGFAPGKKFLIVFACWHNAFGQSDESDEEGEGGVLVGDVVAEKLENGLATEEHVKARGTMSVCVPRIAEWPL